MNKRICFWWIFLSLSVLWAHADGDTYNQVASMEYKQWGFTPKWYYYSWYYKRILGVKVKLPGMGVHDRGPAGIGFPGDRYVSQRWRQMGPLRHLANLEVSAESNQVDFIRRQWYVVQRRDALEYSDKQLDVGKEVEDNRRRRLSQSILAMVNQLPYARCQLILDEYDRIEQNMAIIHRAFISNAEKIKAYRSQLQSLAKLHRVCETVLVLYGTQQRLRTPPQPAGVNEQSGILGSMNALKSINHIRK